MVQKYFKYHLIPKILLSGKNFYYRNVQPKANNGKFYDVNHK